ncbi:MAG: hypothetical protein IPO62_17705 [Saprospiraceae bacterium]|nr:hypothetical protein [Saprospiraceae bacterium]
MNLIAICSTFITIAVAFLCFKKSNQLNSFHWIKWYCIFSSLVEVVSFILAELKIPNLFLFQFIILIETIIILNYFKVVSSTLNKWIKNWIIVVLICIYLLQYNSFTNLNPFNAILEGMSIFTCCLIYLFDELKIPKSISIINEPNFWFIAAFLIYYGSSWLLLLCAQFVISEIDIFNFVWNAQNIINIIKYIVISIGIRFLS